MAKIDKTTIVDASQDDSLTWQKSGNNITLGPYPDKTYVDTTVQVINEPGGNINDIQINAGGKFAGDNGLTFNRTSDQLNVKGNLNVGGYIKGKIVTNRYNFFLAGGTSGQVLSTDGTGNLTWVDQTGGSGTNYSNANVASYLPTFTGNLAGGNVVVTSGVYAYDISSTGTAFLTTLNVNAESRLGNVGNIKITGGANGQVLSTDGTGNLRWTNPTAGPQGPQGTPGTNGTAATIVVGNVTTGAAGTSVAIVNSGNTTAAIFDFTIPRGDHGEQGPKGDKGDTGATGATGPQGAPGATGPKGDKGDTGAQGIPGNDGAPGADGAPGPTGATGATGPKGDKGDQGIQGSTGAQGAPGPKGDKGDTGDQGVSVTLIGSVPSSADLPTPGGLGEGYITSDTGNLWFWNSLTTSWNDIGKIVGPQGDPGPQGATGAQGPQGDQGPAGNDGATGPTGPEGPQGATGATGPKGDTGDQGPAGNDGLDGTSFVWQSQWNNSTPYVANDVVYYLGSTYICTAANADTLPTDTGFWELMTAKGDQGLQGDQGETGPRGYGVSPGGVTGQVLVKSSDTDYDTTWQDQSDSTIHVGNVPPSPAVEGTVWYSSESGRSYIKYNDQWVDMSPQTVDPTPLRPNEDNNVVFPNDAIFLDGRIYQDAENGTTSMRWVNMSDDQQDLEMLRAYRDGIGEGNDERGQLGLRYQSPNVSGLYISSFDNETERKWTFEGTGNLELPRDGKIVLRPVGNDEDYTYMGLDDHGMKLYTSQGGQVTIGTTSNSNNEYIWSFSHEGNIVFPDGTEQTTAYTGQTTDNTILISDNVPSSAPEGTLWFKSDAGRTYVKYSNTWVDASPQTIDPTAVRTNENNDVEFPNDAIFLDGRIYQDAANGTTSMRWINMTEGDSMLRAYKGNNQNEIGQLGVDYQGANTSGMYVAGYENGNQRRWTFEGDGNIRFPDNTIQSTAYQPATLLDGGGADANYSGNVAPGGIANPFDQDLNTSDNVTFLNVTANNFNGTSTLANSAISVPAGNITGLGNISTIDLNGNSNTVLRGDGTWGAGGTTNTGNITFNNVTIQGVSGYSGGIQLSASPEDTANLKYLQVRSGDLDSHIHFDTGNNQIYDQYFGNDYKFLKLEAGQGLSGNVSIGTYQDGGIGQLEWIFDSNGNLRLPTNYSAINYANGSPYVISTTTDNFFINSEDKGLIVDAQGLKRFGFMKYSGIEGSLVHSTNVGAAVPLRIGRTSTADITLGNINTFTTEIYVGTNGHVRIADDTVNDINDPTERLEVVGNIKANNIGNISALNLDGNSANVLYGNGVFAAPAASSSYGNSNVAAYLVDNPQPGTYSNSSVATFLASFGSNTITTTGNLIIGNLAVDAISATANISTTGYFISGNQATGGFQLGNSNSRLRAGDSNSYMTMGQNPSIYPDTAASATAGILIGGNGYLLGNNGARNITLNYAGVSGQVGLQANLQVGTGGSGTVLVPGTTITGVNSILAGPTFTPLANTMAGFVSNVNNYTQLTIQNKSTGTDATTDFIATADNGNDSTNYLDLGIINSGYDNSTPTNSLGNIVFAADSYIYAQGNISNVNQAGGNLAIGTTVPGKTVKFFAGGNTATSLIASFANTGASITGNLSVSGNITGANISGNINITGNVTGTSANVTLVAGSYSTTFDNTGIATFPGAIKVPTLPAFRVYGSVSTSIASGTTITSTNGVTVDYNQGSYYNNTTGIFTAPVAGLYHCFGTVRVGTNNGLNQAAIVKNGTTLSGANTIAFWETDTNTGTASHFSLNGYAKCAVGDTLRLYVVAGNVQFDSNDNWGVTFIG